ncbi:MAG: O-antigen ligase family protein [Clostridia bacterium]|nr:O-antigen ligase family protein [Clostridia bacterium]
MESVFLKIGIRLMHDIRDAYQKSATYRGLGHLKNALASVLATSIILSWLSDNSGLESAYRKSFVDSFKLANKSSPIKSFLLKSVLLRFFMDRRVLSSLVLLQIFTYIFLPTPISVFISLALVALMFFRRWIYDEESSPKNLVVIGLYLLMLFFVVSYLFSPIQGDGLTILVIYIATLLFAATLLGTFNDRRFLGQMMHLFAGIVLLVGLHGIYQRIVGVPVDPAWLDESAGGSGIRIYSVFGNPNVFGEFLVLLLPIVFAGFNTFKNKWVKLIYAGIFAIGGLNVLLTLSRGSMLSLGIAIVLIIIFKDRKYMPLLILGAFMSPYIVPESIINRIMTVFRGGDTSTSYRMSIYTASVDMLKDGFVEGVGLGNFKVLYKAYAYSAAKSFHAHNTPLMLFIEMGIMGIIAWGYYAFIWMREIFSAQKCKNAYSYYAFAAFAGVVGCSIQGMVDHIFHNYDILFFYIIVMTFGVIAAKNAKDVANEQEN